jgi:hypothetical protein
MSDVPRSPVRSTPSTSGSYKSPGVRYTSKRVRSVSPGFGGLMGFFPRLSEAHSKSTAMLKAQTVLNFMVILLLSAMILEIFLL